MPYELKLTVSGLAVDTKNTDSVLLRTLLNGLITDIEIWANSNRSTMENAYGPKIKACYGIFFVI
jgi:hypothetical protein